MLLAIKQTIICIEFRINFYSHISYAKDDRIRHYIVNRLQSFQFTSKNDMN